MLEAQKGAAGVACCRGIVFAFDADAVSGHNPGAWPCRCFRSRVSAAKSLFRARGPLHG